MIPHDDFTPHGYLDNPYHSWKLNPSGVVRSIEPLGMGWHVPNLGSYVRNQFQYTAHLSIGLHVGELTLITPNDFRQHGCMITSTLHTKNRFEYSCVVPQYDLRLTARYFLVQEHTLGCICTLSTSAQRPLPVTLYLLHRHIHNPSTSRLWEHGLYASAGSQEGTVLLGIASEGDVFVHGARSADGLTLTFDEMGYVISLEEAAAWARGVAVASPSITQAQKDTGWRERTLILPCHLTLSGAEQASERIVNIVLARGVSQDQSCQRWGDGIEEIARAEAQQRTDDEQFWRQAPQLSGDWPANWRRGLVYDLETLRMMVRPSSGIIGAAWDAMQIQAPRTVLAEAAMDMLFLSYADPLLAAEVLLGHFELSPRENLPCMREDGSYNMVADDGQICGTAPEWGFPLWCCDQIFRRTGDLHWLRRLYPRAAAYLRWWLEHRRDDEGWLVYACSWESGQDVSSRFGPQQTGGTLIQHVRPADLQASMAQGAAILVRWTQLLAQSEVTIAEIDLPAEMAWWRTMADDFTARTRQMWQNGWFRDYDSTSNEWSSQQDTMHLAPVFCGVSDEAQMAHLRPFLAQPPMHSSGWAPLSWPPVVMTLVGAADEARMPQQAAELAYHFIDNTYRSIDSRTLDEHGGLPGVTREYRRSIRGPDSIVEYANAGIEGYGWGALSVHLLIRYLLGLREEEADQIVVAPMLPVALRRPGAIYQIGPLEWGEHSLHFTCTIRDEHNFSVHMTGKHAAGAEAENEARQWEWDGAWGEVRKLHLPSMQAS